MYSIPEPVQPVQLWLAVADNEKVEGIPNWASRTLVEEGTAESFGLVGEAVMPRVCNPKCVWVIVQYGLEEPKEFLTLSPVSMEIILRFHKLIPLEEFKEKYKKHLEKINKYYLSRIKYCSETIELLSK